MKAPMTIDRAKVWIAIAFLALFAFASFWTLQTIRRYGDEDGRKSSQRSDPDYFVEHFNFIKLSNKGSNNYHVTGDKLMHLPRSDQYEILHPVINSFAADAPPVTIRAERALVEQKSQTVTPKREHDLLQLYDKVSVERTEGRNAEPIRLETEYLQMWPDLNLAKTDQPVKLLTSNSVTTAVGMTANNETQQVDLLSQVHIHLNRTKRNSAVPH